jgi:hypothetical protein
MNTDLKYIKIFHDLLYQWKHLELLKFCQEVKKKDSYSEDILVHMGYKKEIASGTPITNFDIDRLYCVATLFAEMEAGLNCDYYLTKVKISYDSKKPEEGYLSVSFPGEDSKGPEYVKRVTFSSTGVKVEDLAG